MAYKLQNNKNSLIQCDEWFE